MLSKYSNICFRIPLPSTTTTITVAPNRAKWQTSDYRYFHFVACLPFTTFSIASFTRVCVCVCVWCDVKIWDDLYISLFEKMWKMRIYKLRTGLTVNLFRNLVSQRNGTNRIKCCVYYQSIGQFMLQDVSSFANVGQKCISCNVICLAILTSQLPNMVITYATLSNVS